MSQFSLRDFLPYLLNQAAEEASLSFQKVYKGRYGMLRAEWRVLFYLGNHGPMTASAISVDAKTHKTKISRAVSALEAKRFLTRERQSGDRRNETLSLTAAGEAAYQDLMAEAERYEAKLIADLDPNEVTILRQALKKLAKMV